MNKSEAFDYSPHGRSLRVAPCPPGGAARLWPGEAGSTAPLAKTQLRLKLIPIGGS